MDVGSVQGIELIPNTTVKAESKVKSEQVENTQLIQGINLMEKVKEQPGYIPTIQEKAVIKAIEAANRKQIGGREFEFSIHQKTKQIMVKVLDANTKEVIREVPPEKILDMVAGMWEAAGLFVDEKR